VTTVTSEMRRRLAKSLYVELRTVGCGFEGGTLTLTGSVPTFYLKQVATSLTEGLDGVARVANQIEVVDRRARSTSATG